MRIYADLISRRAVTDPEIAKAYALKTGRKITVLYLKHIKREEVAEYIPAPVDKGKKIFCIFTRARWQQIQNNQLDQWQLYNFDSMDFDLHRTSLDGNMALFENHIKTQAAIDKLNQWKAQGVLVDWFYYDHQEFDQDGNPTDTNILDFLNGNVEWNGSE